VSLGGRVKLEMAYLRQVVSCVFLLLIALVFIIILSTPVQCRAMARSCRNVSLLLIALVFIIILSTAIQCRAMARSCRNVSLLLIALVFIIILSTPIQCRAMAINSNANEKTGYCLSEMAKKHIRCLLKGHGNK